MRIFLTGATGFLGSHVAETLVHRGHTVHAAVRPTSRTEFLRALPVTLHPVALADPAGLERALTGADAVVHLAAHVHTTGPWREFHETTVTGTANLLAAARAAGVSHFLQLSTVGVYGRPRRDGRPFTETDDYGRPYRWNYYSRAKILAEQLVRASPLATTILRPTWIYGPRDTTSLGAISNALRHRRYRWIGDGHNRLSLLYVTDVAAAIALAVEHPAARGEIFNVAADNLAPTQREFITYLCELQHLPLPTTSLPYRLAHAAGWAGECVAHLTGFRVRPPLTRLSVLLLGGSRHYNGDKIRRVLGWQPTVSFTEGLRRALASS